MSRDIVSLPPAGQRKTSASLKLQDEPFPVICTGSPAPGVPVAAAAPPIWTGGSSGGRTALEQKGT